MGAPFEIVHEARYLHLLFAHAAWHVAALAATHVGGDHEEAGESNHDIDDPFKPGDGSEDHRNEVEIKRTDETPVHGTDNDQDHGDDV